MPATVVAVFRNVPLWVRLEAHSAGRIKHTTSDAIIGRTRYHVRTRRGRCAHYLWRHVGCKCSLKCIAVLQSLNYVPFCVIDVLSYIPLGVDVEDCLVSCVVNGP